MTSNQPYRPSGKKLAAGLVLALLLGALTPLLTVMEASMLMPVIALSGVFMVFLFVFAGPPSAWLFMMIQFIVSSMLLNTTFMWLLLLSGCIPAVLTMRGIAQRRPFFDQMRVSMALYGLGMLGALALLWSRYGGGMIAQATDALAHQFDLMPDAFFEPFVRSVNSMLDGSGIPGAPRFTVASYREQIVGVLNLAKQTYQAGLPGALLSGAALSGVLSTLWGNWLMARRGMATEESYIPLTRWFLPAGVTGGLTLIWVVAFILSETGYASGDSVYVAAYGLVNVAFTIQALAAVDRFFFRRGMEHRPRRRRVILILILSLVIRFAGIALFFIGAGSALFGSHGAIRALMDRDNDDRTE